MRKRIPLNSLPLGTKIFGTTILGSGLVSLVEVVMVRFGSPLQFVLIGGVGVCIAAGIGLLELQEWARWLCVIGAGVSLVSNFLMLAVPQESLPSLLQWVWVIGEQWESWLLVREKVWLGFVWNGLALWYFLRPAVKAQFTKKSE